MRDKIIIFLVIFSTLAFGLLFTINNAKATTEECPTLSSGDLFKVPDNTAVYLVNSDMKRMYFPSSEVFHTWFNDFSEVITIDNTCVDNYPVPSVAPYGINYRPGSRLIKLQISPSVYAVLPGNTRAKIADPMIAQTLYGENWASKVRDIADVYWPNYVSEGEQVALSVLHNGMLVTIDDETIYYISEGIAYEVEGALPDSDGIQTVTQHELDSFEISMSTMSAESIVSMPEQIFSHTDDEEEVVIPTIPAVVQLEQIVDPGSEYTFAWEAVSGAVNYCYQKSTDEDFAGAVDTCTSGSDVLSITESNEPSQSTTYYYRVKACNSAGCSNYSGSTYQTVTGVIKVPEDFATISEAIDAAWSGTKYIKVAAGTYNEQLVVPSDVIIEGAGIDQTFIEYENQSAVKIIDGAEDVTLKRLTIRDSGNYLVLGGGVYISNSDRITIEDCKIYNNRAWKGSGMYIYYSTDIEIKNSLIVGNLMENEIGLGGGMYVAEFSDVDLVNVTMVDNMEHGIYAEETTSVDILNSILWNNEDSLKKETEMINNFTYNYSNLAESDLLGDGLLREDPDFVGDGDYHLRDGSPCIDSGSPLTEYNDSDGTRNDMGAYGG